MWHNRQSCEMIQGVDIAVNRVSVRVQDEGVEGGPPIVLAHGLASSLEEWGKFRQMLSRTRRVLSYDLRGHGHSGTGPCEAGPTIDLLAEDLAALVQHFGLRKPILIGHSLGALTVLRLAQRAPKLPLALILEEPPQPPAQRLGDTRPLGATQRALFDWLRQLKIRPVEFLVAEAKRIFPNCDQAGARAWADAIHQVNLPFLERLQYNAEDIIGDLGCVWCPVLLMIGNPARGGMMPPQSAQLFSSLLPQCTTVYFERAGHNVRREAPTEYMKEAMEFIERQHCHLNH
jgi:pimeloyl-ACP methyl ester carboxylesterase